MPRLLDAAEAPPDGVEPLEEAVARARAAIDDASLRGETSVLFTHGRILASCLARATGQRPSELWSSLSNPDVFAVAGDSVQRIWGADPQTRTRT
jgi:broad specificity phosphatase PhoE